MNPESTVYGCASCGVWVILPSQQQPWQRTLLDLEVLRLSNDKLEEYNLLSKIKKMSRGVTTCTNKSAYFLYRIYLATPYTLESLLDSVEESSIAFLCQSCYKHTHKSQSSQRKLPPFSLSTGVDYGLAWIFMPDLSYVEKMLLERYHAFAHVFKISTGVTQMGLRGSVVAMKTSAADIMAEKLKLKKKDSEEILPLHLPHQLATMQIQFLGPMHKWDRIKSDINQRLELIVLFKKVLEVDSKKLLEWITVLQEQYPNFNIHVDFEYIKQDNLDKMVEQMILNATSHDVNSMETKIDSQARLNVPGAAEGEDVSNGIEQVFVSEEENITSEFVEGVTRKQLLSSVLKQLPVSEGEKPIVIGIPYEKDEIGNEYTQLKEMMEGLFPWLFPNGYPYDKPLQQAELKHMLHQASNNFTSDTTFISLTFDMMRRRSVSTGVTAIFKNDPESLNQFKDAINDIDFKDTLLEAIKLPQSKLAKEMESWLNSIIHKAAKNVPFAVSKSSVAFSEMLAMNRYSENYF